MGVISISPPRHPGDGASLASGAAQRRGGFKPYPLHLGVTEAGEAEDGRSKSAVGIGAEEDGLGDTVRVSLTKIEFSTGGSFD
jgi:4-hydroxy-3-methylbut-2-en-1-yl diphosphate synthase IspG/GcpE